ncbi:hypothetical protein FACS189431_3200 [Alphaproteobacteria bacterium]|nr:hypothetical protein FACS189431_3200 [Alphaproteobacteria bacterium]
MKRVLGFIGVLAVVIAGLIAFDIIHVRAAPATTLGQACNGIDTATGQDSPGTGGSENIIMDIDDNMVPIKWDGTQWITTDRTNPNNTWYNYDKKQWANAVTLTSTSLPIYRDGAIGTPVADADVLGYWVYIPRYRYKVQRCSSGDQAIEKPMAFNIQFENKDAIGYTKAIPGQKGDWATHPAFTFASDVDRRTGNTYPTNELNGIWAGKYETTGTDVAPTVKDDTPLVSQSVSAQFTTSKLMGKVGSTGQIFADFTDKNTHNFSTGIDTRMAKNDDWGAIAYLTTSRIGNNTIEIMDTTPGTDKTSTTGNKYGIYNLGGSVVENTMAVYNKFTSSSGFNAINNPLPNPQYYNNYTFYDLAGASCDFANCGGQALRETTGWNADVQQSLSSAWVRRGGDSQSASSGLFATEVNNGGAGLNSVGFRIIANTMANITVQSYPAGQTFLTIGAINGDTLVFGSKINVGGQPCTNVVIIGPNKATCNTPALAGLGDKPVTIVPPPASTANMQNWTGCSTMSIGDKVILQDTRNGQNYRVRKMEDDRCWMIDNMKFDNYELTPADSNVANNYNLMAVDNSTTGQAVDTPYLKDPATGSTYKNSCIYRMGIHEDSLTGCGYLYSWSAATAGTGDGISANGNMTGSICPTGWRLPTYTPNEFQILNGSMIAGYPAAASNTDTDDSRANWWSQGPFSGAYSGDFIGAGFHSQGYSGNWWSSSAVGNGSQVISYNVRHDRFSGAQGVKYVGYAVRCILN